MSKKLIFIVLACLSLNAVAQGYKLTCEPQKPI